MCNDSLIICYNKLKLINTLTHNSKVDYTINYDDKYYLVGDMVYIIDEKRKLKLSKKCYNGNTKKIKIKIKK